MGYASLKSTGGIMFTISIIDVVMFGIVGVPALYVMHDIIKIVRGGRK